MSLINEALKKAQRARTAGAPDDRPPVPGGGPVAKRGQARSANTIVLLGSGAVVLVVLTVVLTIYLLHRPSAQPTTTASAPKPPVTTAAVDSAPAIVTPAIPAPPLKIVPAERAAPPPAAPLADKPASAATAAPATADMTKAAPITSAPQSAAPILPAPAPAPGLAVAKPPTSAGPAATSPAPIGTPAAAPAAAAKAPGPLPAAAPPARPDERVAAYVESLRIMGVRASGADSRVLINERVYRVNDIIERTLGVRLVKVDQGSLTFADQNGVTYLRYL